MVRRRGDEAVAKRSMSRFSIIRPCLALALATAAAGCAAQGTTTAVSRGGYYRSARSNAALPSHPVAPGETIYRIARQYGVSTERLMALNDITDPRELRVGQVLIIPRGGIDDSATSAARASAFGIPDWWSVPRADRQFAWPVTAGTVSSPFGVRNGAMHDGVDIAAPAGTPVYAADAGSVIFAGDLHGYGNVVIVQHSGGYTTIYGHNQRNLVDKGARVVRGQEIAEIGTSGRTSGPNLHFEVRYKNQAENPLAYLPTPNGGAAAISFARNGGS